MRVISGTLRSRLLKQVESNQTRETRDRIKESIFGTIHFDCLDAVVLDLFAGSGSLGIEAISRGSKHCDFVDQMAQAIKVVKDNVNALNITSKACLYHLDYKTFLKQCDRVYDLIFLDPPYQTYNIDELIETIETEGLLSETGRVVLLTHKSEVINLSKHGIIEYKSKIKGITKMIFLRWETK